MQVRAPSQGNLFVNVNGTMSVSIRQDFYLGCLRFFGVFFSFSSGFQIFFFFLVVQSYLQKPLLEDQILRADGLYLRQELGFHSPAHSAPLNGPLKRGFWGTSEEFPGLSRKGVKTNISGGVTY